MQMLRRRLARQAGLIVLSTAAVVLLIFGAGSAGAALTGAGAQKNCNSPVFVGGPVVCTYGFQNQDDFGNNETVNSLVDVTQTAGGAQSSGNIFSSVGWVFEATPNGGTNPNASPSCVGGSGAGTDASPYFGATQCTVPVSIVNIMGTNFTIGARIRSAPFSWYTATAADFNLPNHQLSDQDDFIWQCTLGNGSSCNPAANSHATAPATVTLQKRPSQVDTTIHNAAHATVTSVPAGTTVHDLVTVSSPNPAQAPTGNVNVDWFTNGTCAGAPAANSGSIGPLAPDGKFDATGFAQTPAGAGSFSFRGHYEGDGTYLPSDGPCEPLLVADSSIVTHVRDAQNNDITNANVPSGTVVHDEATVTKAAGTPAGTPDPSGTVTFTLYDNGTCDGNVLATDPNKPLAGGTATSVTFTTPLAGGNFSYRAHYNGDANYPGHDATCEPFQVNANEGQARVTGGGSIFDTVDGVPDTRITHGFELRCTPNDKRQSLEINWAGTAGANNFHLEKIINSVVCFDDPATQPPPPPGTLIDTYAGNSLFNGHTGYHGFGYAVGTGICNKLPATIYFILIDAGEPGTGDVAEYHITGGCTLNVGPAFLDKGNHQFHKS